jgi:hypothetical protein
MYRKRTRTKIKIVSKIFIITYAYFGLLMKERSRGTYGSPRTPFPQLESNAN